MTDNILFAKFKIELSFTEILLGAVPDRSVYADYIQTKVALTDEAAAEELEKVAKIEERGWTKFYRDPKTGGPLFRDYCLKGFMKEVCGALRKADVGFSKKLTSYKKAIDLLVMPFPKWIPLVLPAEGEIGLLERPLRADTAQGPRVTLARSDTCPVETHMSFTVETTGESVKGKGGKLKWEDLLGEWLSYGVRHGLGQWRSGGHGRFVHTMERVE
jgi:hypothetical protein